MIDSYGPSKPQAYQLQARMQVLTNERPSWYNTGQLVNVSPRIKTVCDRFASWEEGAIESFQKKEEAGFKIPLLLLDVVYDHGRENV